MVSQKKDFIGKRSLSKDAFVSDDRQTIVGLVPVDKKSKIPEGLQEFYSFYQLALNQLLFVYHH